MDFLGRIPGEKPVASGIKDFQQVRLQSGKAVEQEPSETVDLSFRGSLPLNDKARQGITEKADKNPVIPEAAQPSAKPVKGDAPSSGGTPTILTMGDSCTSSGSPSTLNAAGAGYSEPSIRPASQKLFAKALDIKKRGKSVQPDDVLAVYREIKEKAGETGSPAIELLCSRFKNRAERAQALKEARAGGNEVEPSENPEAQSYSAKGGASPENALMNTDIPYLDDETWSALADGITRHRWMPGPPQIEMLKARMTVPSGTAGLSIVGRDGQDDSDFRGAVKVLKALKSIDRASVERLTFSDTAGNQVPVSSALIDRIISDPQIFSMPSCVSGCAPPSDRLSFIKDVYELAGNDSNMKAGLLCKMENAIANKKSLDSMDRESIMTLAVLMGIGKDDTESGQLNNLMARHLSQRQTTDSIRTLLNGRRRAACDEIAERLGKGGLSPESAMKAMTDLVVMTFCSGISDTSIEKALSPYLPVLAEGLDSLRESPDYGRFLTKLVESAEARRAKAGTIGGMELPDLARLYLLAVAGRKDKALTTRLQKLMEPELRKTRLKGQNADIASMLLTGCKRNMIADSAQKLQTMPLSRSERLELYRQSCELCTGIPGEAQRLQREAMDAFLKGLTREPSSGLTALTERFENPAVALRVYTALAPGAESDEDVAAALNRFLFTLDHREENLRKLESGKLDRSELLSILDGNCEPAHILQTTDASALKKESREAVCRGFQSNPTAGLADLPSHFSNPDIAIRVYRTLAPGAEKAEEIGKEWSRFRDILDIAGGESKLKEATKLYCFWKQQQAQGKSWKEVMEKLYTARIMGQDYSSMMTESGFTGSSDTMVIDSFDDDTVSIGGITLNIRRD